LRQRPLDAIACIGELAQLYNQDRKIGCDLRVIKMDGWRRTMWFDATNLTWVNPSPNMRSLTEATLYPGIGLLETTNVSVGRGTDTPFEVVGAPWVNARELAQYLNERSIPGVRFVPVSFTPASSNYSGKACQGVNLVLLDRNVLDAPELGVELALALSKLYPPFRMELMKDLLVNAAAYEALAAGRDPRRIADDWRESVEAFQKTRDKYLLYK